MLRMPFLRPTALIDFPNQVLILAKPDAVHNGLVWAVLQPFELGHWWIQDVREFQPPKSFWAKHYCDHVGKDFYEKLVDFMTSGLTLAFRMQYCAGTQYMIEDARGKVDRIRKTHFCQNPRNLVHASDSLEAAKRELNLWFPNARE